MALGRIDSVGDQTSVAPGLSDFTVSGIALTGMLAFSSLANGSTYRYRAQVEDNTSWEVGQGVWNSGTSTLTRATIYQSSTGAKVNFASSVAVIVTFTAADLSGLDASLSQVSASLSGVSASTSAALSGVTSVATSLSAVSSAASSQTASLSTSQSTVVSSVSSALSSGIASLSTGESTSLSSVSSALSSTIVSTATSLSTVTSAVSSAASSQATSLSTALSGSVSSLSSALSSGILSVATSLSGTASTLTNVSTSLVSVSSTASAARSIASAASSATATVSSTLSSALINLAVTGSAGAVQVTNGAGELSSAAVFYDATAGTFGWGSGQVAFRKSGSLANTVEIVNQAGSAWGSLRTDGYVQVEHVKTNSGGGAALKSDNTLTHLAAFSADTTTIRGFAGTQFRVTAGASNWTVEGALQASGTSGEVALTNGSGSYRDLILRTITLSGGLLKLPQYTTGTEPAFVNGAAFFNSDLDAIRVGGASAWETVATGPGGGGGGSTTGVGTATLNFGAWPGSNEAYVDVTGQTAIDTTATVALAVRADDTTTDHSASDHRYVMAFLGLTADTPTAGVGFRIYARSTERLTGQFKVRFLWSIA